MGRLHFPETRPMPRTAWLAPLADTRFVRRAADAGFVQVAHHRVKQLDRINLAKVQEATLLQLVRLARDTRFGRDHDFASIRCIEDYQSQVPVREYEAFWNTYWKDAYPRLEGATWPTKIPYYAL